MGCIANCLNIGGRLKSILEGVGDICNANGEVVGGSNGNNCLKCSCCKNWRRRLFKVDTFHLTFIISAMVKTILVYVVTNTFYAQGHNILEDVGYAW